MKKESFDKVAVKSVLLKQKLLELEECKKEKEAILKEIEELHLKNKYEENHEMIKEKMDNNLKRFEKILEDVKKIKTLEGKEEKNIKK